MAEKDLRLKKGAVYLAYSLRVQGILDGGYLRLITFHALQENRMEGMLELDFSLGAGSQIMTRRCLMNYESSSLA